MLFKEFLSSLNEAETVKPKNRFALEILIRDTIEKEGNNCDLNFIDVSNVKDMSYMFYTSNFTGKNSPGMDKWNVSNVEKMDSMFERSEFAQDISGWEIDPSCSTEAMFAHCPLSNKHEFIPQCLLRRI